MSRIAAIQIENFRSIEKCTWYPKAGFNCLFGPGDSGKSSILEAINWCLSGNQSRRPTDADFFQMDPQKAILIRIMLVDLPDALLSVEKYGLYHNGFNVITRDYHDEPGTGFDTALTITMTVDETLVPVRRLTSERVEDEDRARRDAGRVLNLIRMLRIQDGSSTHLGFGQGSVLYRLTDENLELSEALANAARAARTEFGHAANDQLSKTLARISEIATVMGISAAIDSNASIDAAQSTFRPSNIALHADNGVPLNSSGLGTSRLLIAALHKHAADGADIGVIDEIEAGLEPHRIIRLLHALGSKDEEPAIQVFATTHSAVVLRELDATQLARVQNRSGTADLPALSAEGPLPGTLRTFPEAFLAKSVIICDGA